MADYDVVVLGAGPGGYVAAIRAAQLGKNVAVVEMKYWGGVCLNVGCIPSKALLRNAEIAHIITKEKKTFGIEGDATMAFGPTFTRSRAVADASAKGVHYLMKKNQIDEIDGWGTITSPTSLDVTLTDTSRRTVTFDNLIIATGATVRMLPGMTVSEKLVTYEEQILDGNLPGSVIIGGSGAIGVEFAYVMTNFGVDVTIVEFLDRMVPTEDAEVSKELLRQYKKLGVKVLLSTAVKNVEDTGSGVRVTVAPADGGVLRRHRGDKFLRRSGFRPRLDGTGSRPLVSRPPTVARSPVDARGPHQRPRRLRDRRRHRQADARAQPPEAMGVVAPRPSPAPTRSRSTSTSSRGRPSASRRSPRIGYSEEQAKEKGYDVRAGTVPVLGQRQGPRHGRGSRAS
jgi:dihydrolipoamide dehydrogenase